MSNTKISDLTGIASGLLADADEFAVADASDLSVTYSITGINLKTYMGNALVLAAGSASANTWPKMTSGTLLTTAEAGALEMDANNMYGTTDAGNRGYIPIKHFIRADSTRTFTSNTSSQAIFTSPTNGRITLETGLYRIQGVLYFTAMSATSGNLLVNLLGAGTATVGAWMWMALGQDTAAGTVLAGGGVPVITSTSSASIVPATTATALGVVLNGTFEVTGAGTMIPAITMVTASSTVLAIGSFLMFERMGSTTVVSVGQWD